MSIRQRLYFGAVTAAAVALAANWHQSASQSVDSGRHPVLDALSRFVFTQPARSSFVQYSGTPNLVSAPPVVVPVDGGAGTGKPPSSGGEILAHGFHGPKYEALFRLAYAGAYDRRTRNAVWVAERLTRTTSTNLLTAPPDSSIQDGPAPSKPDRRNSHFKEDTSIPTDFRVRPNDYMHTGYDRGHLVPAADVTSSQEAIDETFYMTNMSPQVPAFNRGVWASLESVVRKKMVSEFDEVFIVTGPLFLPKQDAVDGKYYVKYEVIGRDKTIAVPSHFYKVVLGVKGGKYYMGSFVMANEGVASDVPLNSFTMPVSGNIFGLHDELNTVTPYLISQQSKEQLVSSFSQGWNAAKLEICVQHSIAKHF
ncbi:nuclease [Entophlyctis luteolus]|nr:nuclease [Entophlyctis luteolus]